MTKLEMESLLLQIRQQMDEVARQLSGSKGRLVLEQAVLLAAQDRLIKTARRLLIAYTADDPLAQELLRRQLFDYDLEELLAQQAISQTYH